MSSINSGKTMISVSLFRLKYEYKPFSAYLDGIYRLINIIKDRDDLFIRIYYNNTINHKTIKHLQLHKNVEMVYFDDDNQELLGALMRYKPLFEKPNNVDYILVFDLDSNDTIYEEFIGYLPVMKKAHFSYSVKLWYKSGRYWYDELTRKSKQSSHIIRGWGMGFVSGLLEGNSLLDDYIASSKMTIDNTTDPIIKQFKTLNLKAINMKSYNPKKNFTWSISDRMQYGVVELFTTFYLFPTLLKMKINIMQISVQFGILHCLIEDLLDHVPLSTKNYWFRSEFNIEYYAFLKLIKENNRFGRNNNKLIIIWEDFIKFMYYLINENRLVPDSGLWNFIRHTNIYFEKNNKKFLKSKDKLALLNHFNSM